MRNSFSKKQLGLAVACALALGLMSGAARAQSASGWLQDSQGNAVRTSTGQCVHAGTPANPISTFECDPNFKPVAEYVAPAPQPVAAAPAMAPMAKVIPAPVPQKLTFDADALFDVDKSVLRPAGRTTLDNFVYRIKDINPEAIMVVGHASRPGTEQHNQGLSEERAESVKAYLVGAGIAPYRVRTSGMGETQPVTFTGECLSDSNMSAKAIACRQPDRRVEIELIGARIPQ
jgi:OmpA-OmpF porin, OOP family